MRDRRIESIRAWVAAGGEAVYFPPWVSAQPLASPLQGHADRPVTLGGVAVEVECADGRVGVGVAHGGAAACFVVERGLAPLLAGADSEQVEELWELMLRASALYGAGGVVLSAVSGVDLALWDLRGRRAELPVFELLAPGSSPRVELYATGPRPGVYEREGYRGAKVSLPYGSALGERGFRANLERLADWRNELAGECFFAVDCFMGLDEPYAHRLLSRVRGLGLRWLEEPLPPWELEGLGRLRSSGVPIAAGEHHDNFELERLVRERLADVVQPELTWCGGLTPVLRLAEAAAASGILLVPHAGGVFAQHFVAASPHTPFAELVLGGADGDEADPTFDALVRGEPLPRHGVVELASEPGFGVSLREGLTRPSHTSLDHRTE